MSICMPEYFLLTLYRTLLWSFFANAQGSLKLCKTWIKSCVSLYPNFVKLKIRLNPLIFLWYSDLFVSCPRQILTTQNIIIAVQRVEMLQYVIALVKIYVLYQYLFGIRITENSPCAIGNFPKLYKYFMSLSLIVIQTNIKLLKITGTWSNIW